MQLGVNGNLNNVILEESAKMATQSTNVNDSNKYICSFNSTPYPDVQRVGNT